VYQKIRCCMRTFSSGMARTAVDPRMLQRKSTGKTPVCRVEMSEKSDADYEASERRSSHATHARVKEPGRLSVWRGSVAGCIATGRLGCRSPVGTGIPTLGI
jgi:hypothetical protein